MLVYARPAGQWPNNLCTHICYRVSQKNPWPFLFTSEVTEEENAELQQISFTWQLFSVLAGLVILANSDFDSFNAALFYIDTTLRLIFCPFTF